MALLRKLVNPGQPWRLREHFAMSVAMGIVVLGGLGIAVSGTSPPTHTVVPVHPKNPIEIVLDPPISGNLAPIPMQER